MKSGLLLLTFIILLVLAITLSAQINPICKERGHVVDPATVIFLPRFMPPAVIDYPDSSVSLTYSSGKQFRCKRCGKTVFEEGKERRQLVWVRPGHSVDDSLQSVLDRIWIHQAKEDVKELRQLKEKGLK